MNFELRPNAKSPEIDSKDQAVQLLLDVLEKSGFQEDFQGEVALARKEKLQRIAKQLPMIGDRILHTFKALAQAEGLEPGNLTFFVVGGRVLATPIKDSTDFDVVISAENKLTPFSRAATITLAQRHAIGQALYDKIETIFESLGLSEDYEKGIIEFKGFGERTAKEVEGGEGVLKLTELT